MSRKLTKEEFMKQVYENNSYVRNGYIEIIGEYNGLEQRIEYLCHRCNTVQNPIALSLVKGHGCKNCGALQSSKTQSKSNHTFQDELQHRRENEQDIYSDDEYINNHTDMWFYCSKGHRWQAKPVSIYRGRGCPYCSNRKVLVGYNDIATTSPDIFQFLANPEDGYKYTRWSNTRTDFRCTLCGHVQNRKIASVAYRGFKCEHCSNGISYPNKFGRAFFDQIPVTKYKAEYYPEWGKPYIYDIYFELNGKKFIVEWDGGQHSEDRNSFYRTLAEHQKIDKIKDRLAQENNVHLIRIDCAKSDPDYIRNNIEKSELNALFDLSRIDWLLCDERAQKNLVKTVCDLWSSGLYSFGDLARKLHLGESTVRDYINRGVNLGWCDYDSKHWLDDRRHPVHVTNIDNGKEYFFGSLGECATGSIDFCGHRIAEETIRKYSKKGSPYNGFLFEIISSTIQN